MKSKFHSGSGAFVSFFATFLIVFIIGVATKATADEPQSKGAAKKENEFQTIFDGKSFKNWEGNKKWFRIEGGAIVAGSLTQKIPNNEFLCTEKSYENFELKFQAKMVGQGKNAGVQFRSKRIPDHHEVIGYQCDMGVMNGKLIWGWLYDESRRRKFLVEGDSKEIAKVFKEKDWNKITIECRDSHVQIWVNGFKTCDYQEKGKEIAKSGIIGLQIHSGPPAEAWYKDIQIKEIKN